MFDKRIGLTCAPLVLSNGTRVAVIVGGKSSESSADQTSYKLAQIEVFNWLISANSEWKITPVDQVYAIKWGRMTKVQIKKIKKT